MRTEAEDDEGVPHAVVRAVENERVLSALGELFRRNSHSDDDGPPGTLPGRWRDLALQALRALMDPSAARLADVGGLRLHLSVPSAPYPGPAVIHASAWDEDAEVWRQIEEIVIEDAGR